MVIRYENPNSYDCVIFDLDETLIDDRTAWCYTIEEAILSTLGKRIDPHPLLEEYRTRPWEDVISLLIENREIQQACLALCLRMERRSSLKHLLVFDGIGMALDKIRDLTEIGVISRWPYSEATKRIQSTGLDRFFTAIIGTDENKSWDPSLQFSECYNLLGHEKSSSLYIGGETFDINSIISHGSVAISAGWAGYESPILTPASLAALVQAGPHH